MTKGKKLKREFELVDQDQTSDVRDHKISRPDVTIEDEPIADATIEISHHGLASPTSLGEFSSVNDTFVQDQGMSKFIINTMPSYQLSVSIS